MFKKIFLFSLFFLTQSSVFAAGEYFRVTPVTSGVEITTTIPNHIYPAAGIRAQQPYSLNCMPQTNGYCLFSVSTTKAASFQVSGPASTAAPVYLTICLNGKAPLSCQSYLTHIAVSAGLAVSGSPLTLTADGITTGNLTITNLSTSVTATNITSIFTNTALEGNVTQTGSTCTSVPPGQSCTLTYTPGTTAVTQTNFEIRGDNTLPVTAAITINSVETPVGYLYISNSNTIDFISCPVSSSGALQTCSNIGEIGVAASMVYFYSVNGTTYGYLPGDSDTVYQCPIVNNQLSLSGCNSLQDELFVSAFWMAINPLNGYAYLTNVGEIVTCPFDSTTGEFGSGSTTSTDCTHTSISGMTLATQLVISGNYLYMVGAVYSNPTQNIVSCFMNSDGTLSSCTTSAMGFIPGGISFMNNGTVAYVTNPSGDSVYSCTVSSGALSGCTLLANGFSFTSNELVAMYSSSAVTNAFVPNSSGNTISICPITSATSWGTCTTSSANGLLSGPWTIAFLPTS